MKIVYSRQAEKDYNRLPKLEQNKINKKVRYLSNSPYIGKPLEGKLKGYFSEKAWPYRIIYQIIESPKRVAIVRILHRQGAYK